MFCLEDYDSYTISESEEVSKELRIVFEANNEDSLEGTVFQFPVMDSIFSPTNSE